MQNMNFYIAYLLTKHECVIIQGFGAFIVSKTPPTEAQKEALLCPPTYSLGFNPEIRHNDGLLANAIAKGEKISYKESCLQISQYVDFLNRQLIEQNKVQILWIGSLSLSEERKIVFTPSIHPSCNALHFGLNNFYMSTLHELEDSIERPIFNQNERRDPVFVSLNRQIIRWASSVAAAALALFLVTTPLNEYSAINSQYASVISLTPKTYEIPVEVAEELKIEELKIEETEMTAEVPAVNEQVIATEEVLPETKLEVLPETPKQYYYIVVASLPTKNSADERMESFQKTDFPEAQVISAKDKHRVYVNKFEDKKEAEKFLKTFRDDNPKYSNAWLLSQKS